MQDRKEAEAAKAKLTNDYNNGQYVAVQQLTFAEMFPGLNCPEH